MRMLLNEMTVSQLAILLLIKMSNRFVSFNKYDFCVLSKAWEYVTMKYFDFNEHTKRST